jgi:hypothetical protein
VRVNVLMNGANISGNIRLYIITVVFINQKETQLISIGSEDTV